MNFFTSLPQYGVYVLGLNLLLCGVTEGFMGFGMDGFEDMFPLLMMGGMNGMNGMNGGRPNYIRPPISPTLPPTPPPPMVKPPSITWRWVPNTRYTWPLFNNMQMPQYNNPYIMPMANNGMAQTGSAFNTNTISGAKTLTGNNMPVPLAPNGQMIGNGGPVQPAAGLMNRLAGNNMAMANQATWNTQSQTTSKGPTPI